MHYNYVKHLNTWFIVFKQSNKARPVHLSLYFSLFQLWNINRFSNGFYGTRGELMKVAKVQSVSTYSKAMQDMVAWKWIQYIPGNTFFGASQFSLAPWQELAHLIVDDGDQLYVKKTDEAADTDPAATDLATGLAAVSATATTGEPTGEPSGKRFYKTTKQAKGAKESINQLNTNYHEPL